MARLAKQLGLKDDLLSLEVSEHRQEADVDLTATYNHVLAMNLGLDPLTDLPLSGPLITAVHRQLLQDARGHDRNPGEFRRTQNWVGPEGCTLDSAHFVPPPPEELPHAMADLGDYLGDRRTPPLVVAGLTHAQFETIHPFGDGNGRIYSYTPFLDVHSAERNPRSHVAPDTGTVDPLTQRPEPIWNTGTGA